MPTDLLARIDGVELCAVGQWAASVGDGTLTLEELESMVQAAQDPHADAAPIKIGHADARFQDADGNPPTAGDGSPAYGWVENLRLSDDKRTLIGDLVGMPGKFAELLPAAFRRRSVELMRSKRIGGRIYKAALTGLAVLGIADPAVKGLADVMAMYTDADRPAAAVIELSERDTAAVPPPAPIQPDGAHATADPEKGATVALSPEVRKALGLADDATDEQINEALTAAGLAVLTPPANPATPPADPAATTPPAAPAGDPQPQPVAASAAPPVVTVDSASFTDLQTRLSAAETELSARRAADDKTRRDGILSQAVRAGKVAPAASGEYRKLLDSDEPGTTALLAALPAVLPVVELGHAGTGIPGADETADDERAFTSFIPGYKKKGV